MQIDFMLSPEEVKRAAAEYIQKYYKTNIDITKMQIVLEREEQGYGYNSSTVTVFKGITARSKDK